MSVDGGGGGNGNPNAMASSCIDRVTVFVSVAPNKTKYDIILASLWLAICHISP